jgi:FYVE zinc finger
VHDTDALNNQQDYVQRLVSYIVDNGANWEVEYMRMHIGNRDQAKLRQFRSDIGNYVQLYDELYNMSKDSNIAVSARNIKQVRTYAFCALVYQALHHYFVDEERSDFKMSDSIRFFRTDARFSQEAYAQKANVPLAVLGVHDADTTADAIVAHLKEAASTHSTQVTRDERYTELLNRYMHAAGIEAPEPAPSDATVADTSGPSSAATENTNGTSNQYDPSDEDLSLEDSDDDADDIKHNGVGGSRISIDSLFKFINKHKKDWVLRFLELYLSRNTLDEGRNLVAAQRKWIAQFQKFRARLERRAMDITAKHISSTWAFLYVCQIVDAIERYYLREIDEPSPFQELFDFFIKNPKFLTTTYKRLTAEDLVVAGFVRHPQEEALDYASQLQNALTSRKTEVRNSDRTSRRIDIIKFIFPHFEPGPDVYIPDSYVDPFPERKRDTTPQIKAQKKSSKKSKSKNKNKTKDDSKGQSNSKSHAISKSFSFYQKDSSGKAPKSSGNKAFNVNGSSSRSAPVSSQSSKGHPVPPFISKLNDFVVEHEQHWIEQYMNMYLEKSSRGNARELMRCCADYITFYDYLAAAMRDENLSVSINNILRTWEFIYVCQIMNSIERHFYQENPTVDSASDNAFEFFRAHPEFSATRYKERTGNELEVFGVEDPAAEIDRIVDRLRGALERRPSDGSTYKRWQLFISEYSTPGSAAVDSAAGNNATSLARTFSFYHEHASELKEARENDTVTEADISGGSHDPAYVKAFESFVVNHADWTLSFMKLHLNKTDRAETEKMIEYANKWIQLFDFLMQEMESGDPLEVSARSIEKAWTFLYVCRIIKVMEQRFTHEHSGALKRYEVFDYFSQHESFTEDRYETITGKRLNVLGITSVAASITLCTDEILAALKRRPFLQDPRCSESMQRRQRWKLFISEYETPASTDDMHALAAEYDADGKDISTEPKPLVLSLDRNFSFYVKSENHRRPMAYVDAFHKFVEQHDDWVLAYLRLYLNKDTIEDAREMVSFVEEWTEFYSKMMQAFVTENLAVSTNSMRKVWFFIMIASVLSEASRRMYDNVTAAAPLPNKVIDFFASDPAFSPESYKEKNGSALVVHGVVDIPAFLKATCADLLKSAQATCDIENKLHRWTAFVSMFEDGTMPSNLLSPASNDLHVITEEDDHKASNSSTKPESKEHKHSHVRSFSKMLADVPPEERRTEVLDIVKQRVDSGAIEWQSDQVEPACLICAQPFTMFRRRHHCRRCGLLVCGKCSKARMELDTLSSKNGITNADPGTKYRACDLCVELLS